MTSSLQGQSIRLELISGKNLDVPSGRIPAGIYVSIKLGETQRWRRNNGDQPSKSHHPTMEIRASFELNRMLGNGEVISKVEMSWNELLDHGDENEAFILSFPLIDEIYPSLKLKVAFVDHCGHDNGALLDSIVECKIVRDTDAGHSQFAEYVTSYSVSHLNDAVEHFSWCWTSVRSVILTMQPCSPTSRGPALKAIFTRVAKTSTVLSLYFAKPLLRPQGHPDHPLSLYLLTEALTWRYNNQDTTADICESAQIYHELLPFCPEDTYLWSTAAGKNGVDYVIRECNNLPIDASDEGIRLCPLGHEHRPRVLHGLAEAVEARFQQCSSIDDIDESIQFGREAVHLCPEGYPMRGTYLNDLAVSLSLHFNHQGNSHGLDEAISLYEAALRLRPEGDEYRNTSLDNLGGALRTRFNQHDDIHDLDRVISLHSEALILRPPGIQIVTPRLTTLPSRPKPDMMNCIPARILTRPSNCTANPFG
ncbi:hypothetical protein EDB19DRAFT_1839425 [Suillus lakei]|nr:hypothetical protein EDB19DRAFT_1839425 [Suillus lakei]